MSEGSFPKAYKDGFKEFFGRDFLVSSDVLIPRPETETAIEIILSLAGKPYINGVTVPERVLPEKPRILDVGTGSGCIAITLKLELPEADLYACDVSSAALKIAMENAKKLTADVEFVKSDLLDNIDGHFDVIVANLPYVDRNWPWNSGIEHEPELALYAENGGLEIIYKLLEQVEHRTKYLILEADPVQHEKIISKAKSQDMECLEIRGYQLLFRVLSES
ncbi:HemK family protein methyltransferase [Candidatus Saccharibacteria bacterium]|nr:HemK family protein methyltransferase [Candidatus Saccharibacteria bacterium]